MIRRGLAMYGRRRLHKRREIEKLILDTRNSLIEKANKEKWEKEQRKWLRDWKKAHGTGPGGIRKTMEAQRGDWCICRKEWTRRDQLV